MITFDELKERMTPEIIKKMVELAEGFEFIQACKGDINLCYIKAPDGFKSYFGSIKDREYTLSFSTLLHRAVEGWNNKTGKFICNLGNYIQYVFEKYYVIDYKPCHLTQCEMAIWDCLLNIL